MALDRTSGFDMLVQVSENELNNQLATAFLAGNVFPSSMSLPFNMGGVVGTVDLNFTTPVADLDQPPSNMGLTIPFTNSQLEITSPGVVTLGELGGFITIVDNIEMITEGSFQIATMDFNSGAPNVMVEFDTNSQNALTPVLGGVGLTLVMAQYMMAQIVLQQLKAGIGRIDLTPPIPVVDDTDPTTIFDIDVTTINDTTAVDRDCITFGVRMANDSGGNINGVTSNFIPAGSQSLVIMSNFWLLARVMRPHVATSLGLLVTDFDTPLRLNHSVPAPGGQGTLTNLEARVIGNRIGVDGRATDSGTGWSAVSNFNFFIDITLAGGSLTVTATKPNVETDVDVEWWVCLVSLGLGTLFGGIVGAIVAAIVLAIVEAIAEGIVNNLIAGGIGSSLGGVPAIPLGPIGSGLTLSSVILDDLELRGSIIQGVSVPVKNQGSHFPSLIDLFRSFTVDLDTGTISGDVLHGTDLIWNPSTGLSANSPAGLTITGTSFGALTPGQISRLPLSTHEIPLALIPFGSPSSFFLPFGYNGFVFGVRTTDGRYAKVQAWRSASLIGGGTLQLDWVTYDTPVPKLDIAARWSVLERGEVTDFIAPDGAFCRTTQVCWCGVFEAWPKLMAFPIDYQWCLCGKVLEEGEGSVDSPHGPLEYKLRGRRLWIETEMGQSVNCELCVSAIDARGQELFTCIQLSQPGIETRCRKYVPKATYLKIEIIPAEPEFSGWRPLIADESAKLQDQVKSKSEMG